jgi:hypothetical protein
MFIPYEGIPDTLCVEGYPSNGTRSLHHLQKGKSFSGKKNWGVLGFHAHISLDR